MKSKLFKPVIFIFASFLFYSCAGTIYTLKISNIDTDKCKKAYIVARENSQYINFKFGIITPYAYIVIPDNNPSKTKVIGNTDLVIKQELEKYGFVVEIGKRGDNPKDIDLIIEYSDTWRWDFKKILDNLEITFFSPNGNIIGKSTYTIYKNKELHNFPTPEKEVPKMIKELLNK